MPAVAKSKAHKHQNTPYTRQSKASKKHDGDADVLAKISDSSNIVENAAKRLYRLVSWVFSSGEDLSKSVAVTASKALHGEKPQRSATSQLEDGLLNAPSMQQDSLLAPDLVPHYLGKTPLAVKARRAPPTKITAPAFRVPSFDSSQFKIPVLPSPPVDKYRHNKALADADASQTKPPPRGRGLKSLEISAETLTRYDQDMIQWLSSQRLTPQDLVDGRSLDDFNIDDRPKLNRLLQDNAFFRRQGLFPPTIAPVHEKSNNGHLPSLKRASSRASLKSPDGANSEKSSHTLQGRRINPRNWQTNSSTGILAAWRDVCEQQEHVAQSISLNVARDTNRPRAPSEANARQDAMLWHENISFSQNDASDGLQPVPELDVDLVEAGEKYWAPIRSYPMPEENSSARDREAESKTMPAQFSNERTHRRRHSRQASVASVVKRSRTRHANDGGRRQSVVRPASPMSVASSRQGRSRRPVNASREASRSRQRSERMTESAKPQMVNSQVQTGDELMLFMQDEAKYVAPTTPSISKERRKRPGCFSALDEDLEEMFGPYIEQPVKKLRLDDEDEDIPARPRVPILREDEAVKRLRALQQLERDQTQSVMTKPSMLSQSTKTVDSNEAAANTGNSNMAAAHSRDAVASVSSAPEPPMTFVFGNTPQRDHDQPKKSPQAKSISLFASSGPAPISVPKAKISEIPNFDFNSTSQSATPATLTNESAKSIPKFTFGITGTDNQPSGSKASFFGSNSTVPNVAVPVEKAKTSPIDGIETSAPKFTFGNQEEDSSRKATSEANMATFKFGEQVKGPAEQNFSGQTNASFHFGSANQNKPTESTSASETARSSEESKKDEFREKTFEKQAPVPVFSFTPSQNQTTTKSAPALSSTTISQDAAKADGPVPKFSFAQVDPTGTNSSASTFSFGSKSSADTVLQPPKATESDQTKSKLPAIDATGSFTFGKTNPTTTAEQSAPTFSFGMDTTSTSNPEKPTSGFTFGAQNTGAPVFGQNTSAPAVAAPSTSANTQQSSTMTFGNQPVAAHTNNALTWQSTEKPSPFGAAQPSTTSSFTGFGAAPPASASNVSSFGAIQTPTSNGFGQPSTTSFGDNQSTMPSFGSGSATPFVFGSSNNTSNNAANATQSNTTPATGFTFGASANAPSGTSGGFQFGGQQNTPAPAAAFQFGTPAANNAATPSFAFNTGTPNAAPSFGFGQTQTAPNSGFASPALQSPAIQSATAPGSPNPFDFGAAPANGPRRIAQPKTRRKPR